MKRQSQQGFAQNEPMIVLSFFVVFCLALAAAFGAMFHWLWIWRIISGFGLFGVLTGVFALVVYVSGAQEKRTAAQQHEPPSFED